MILEWAASCQHVEEGPNGLLTVYGLGLNGFVIEEALPVEVICPVIICLRFDRQDEPGSVIGLNYRVIAPPDSQVALGRTGIEWNPGTAPQLVEPERYSKVLSVPILIREGGQHSVDVWIDGQEPIRLPYAFSAWSL